MTNCTATNNGEHGISAAGQGTVTNCNALLALLRGPSEAFYRRHIMLKIHYEVKGRRLDITEVTAIQKALLDAVVQKTIKTVESKLTKEERGLITIEVKGEDWDALDLKISGPTEVLAKLREAG